MSSLRDRFSMRSRPTGVFRWLLRLPIGLFRARLGFIFGSRLAMLVHRGRRSSVLRRTVLEVVEHRHGEYVFSSGTGPGADWYLNAKAHPIEELWVGARHWKPTQRFLDDREAAEVFARYETRRPATARRLLSIMGNSYDGSDRGRIEMMSEMPMVALSDS